MAVTGASRGGRSLPAASSGLPGPRRWPRLLLLARQGSAAVAQAQLVLGSAPAPRSRGQCGICSPLGRRAVRRPPGTGVSTRPWRCFRGTREVGLLRGNAEMAVTGSVPSWSQSHKFQTGQRPLGDMSPFHREIIALHSMRPLEADAFTRTCLAQWSC